MIEDFIDMFVMPALGFGFIVFSFIISVGAAFKIINWMFN